MTALTHTLLAYVFKINRGLSFAGEWLSMLILRIFVGYEFFDAGLTKYNGQNWFADIQDNFPLPFNLLPVDINWFLATWFELIGGIAIILGLFTRFFSASLFILTLVAWAGFHAGEQCGYTFSGCGYKFVVIFLIFLSVLILSGGGKASLDHLLKKKFQ